MYIDESTYDQLMKDSEAYHAEAVASVKARAEIEAAIKELGELKEFLNSLVVSVPSSEKLTPANSGAAYVWYTKYSECGKLLTKAEQLTARAEADRSLLATEKTRLEKLVNEWFTSSQDKQKTIVETVRKLTSTESALDAGGREIARLGAELDRERGRRGGEDARVPALEKQLRDTLVELQDTRRDWSTLDYNQSREIERLRGELAELKANPVKIAVATRPVSAEIQALDSEISQLKSWLQSVGVGELAELQRKHKAWADHNFPKREGWMPLLGVGEELGELNHAHLKMAQGIRGGGGGGGGGGGLRGAAADAIGDLVIYLVDYCGLNGYDLGECVELAWENVRERDWIRWPLSGRAGPEIWSVDKKRLSGGVSANEAEAVL